MGAHAVSLGERLLRPKRARAFPHSLPDGLTTTVHMAVWPRRTTRIRVVTLDPPQPLRAWARGAGVLDAVAIDACAAAALAAGLDGDLHPPTAPVADARHPRAAFGVTRDAYLAVVCDGHSMRDAGMTVAELAALVAELGAVSAITVATGGSAALVCSGRLQNRPRDDNGVALLGGRPIASALVFER
jgi:Phosphodiester glycosidase